MQIHNAHSVSSESLLNCRAAMLGLDLGAIEFRAGQMFESMNRRCTLCSSHEACELDLRRDPNDPAWEAYCPNTATLVALTQAWWLTR